MTVFSPILGLVAEDSDHVRTQQMSCPSYHVAYFVTIFTTDTEDGHRSSGQQSKIQLSARLVSSWELRRICSMPLSQLLVVAGNSRNLLKSHNSYFCLHCHMFAPMSLCLCVSSLPIRIPVILGEGHIPLLYDVILGNYNCSGPISKQGLVPGSTWMIRRPHPTQETHQLCAHSSIAIVVNSPSPQPQASVPKSTLHFHLPLTSYPNYHQA